MHTNDYELALNNNLAKNSFIQTSIYTHFPYIIRVKPKRYCFLSIVLSPDKGYSGKTITPLPTCHFRTTIIDMGLKETCFVESTRKRREKHERQYTCGEFFSARSYTGNVFLYEKK